MFRLGLIVNPLAGLGGAIALKGSDDIQTVDAAVSLGAVPRANQRTLQALSVLTSLDIDIITYPDAMGETAAREAGFSPVVLGATQSGLTTANDTECAAQELIAYGIDLLLFAGGDGTARNICNVVTNGFPVLGIPAGVKIHSGVYAVTPKAAGEIVAMLACGDLVTLAEQEVRDIDEQAFREGRVSAKHYGNLFVPQEHRYLQNVKESGKEVEALVLDDIAAGFADTMEEGVRYIMGSGSTVAALMAHLNLDNTLLGVDVIEDGELIASDCTAAELLLLTNNHPTILVITIIGGQLSLIHI